MLLTKLRMVEEFSKKNDRTFASSIFEGFVQLFFFFLGLDCYKTASHITGSILSHYCKEITSDVFLWVEIYQ